VIRRILPKALIGAALLYLLQPWKRQEPYEAPAEPLVTRKGEVVIAERRAEAAFRSELEEVWKH